MIQKFVYTIKDAIEMGYTHCAKQRVFDGYGGNVIRIDSLNNDNITDEDDPFILCDKELRIFKIPPDLIYHLIDDYLCGQDEVDDEDGLLNDALSHFDFRPITDQINELFKTFTYYSPSDNILGTYTRTIK